MQEGHAEERLSGWLAELGERLGARDPEAVIPLFQAECYWRDLLCFTWSIVTLEGADAIRAMLVECLDRAAPTAFRLEPGTAKEEDGVTEGWFRFETAEAQGRGHIRLKEGRCWTLLTAMLSLKGHEERTGTARVQGTEHGAIPGRQSWREKREQTAGEIGTTRQPYCLIIGGGQGGVALAARLKMLDVPALVIDKHPRPGDAWRARYKSLCLHDAVWANHLPYLPFPEHWPVFTPKDKMGDWLEAYAGIMELDIWNSTAARSAHYDEEAQEWSVEVEQEGEAVTLRPKQLVIATGMSGAPAIPKYEGAESFQGKQCHSSAYRSGEGMAGKRCVVIGSNNSAHDICADLWEHGADVTMVQRSSTLVVRASTHMKFFASKLYSEEAVRAGIDTEQADFIAASRPHALLPDMHRRVYQDLVRYDAEFYEQLRQAGFLLDFGEDESGLSIKYIRRGSGYYIDVGASELVIKGEIKLRSGVQVRRILPDGVELDDGSILPAELIVYATGYDPMERWIEQLISAEAARKVGHIWGVGSATTRDPGPWIGELRNMWKPTRQEGLWLMGGNLQQARFYSKYLAMQLKARLEGLPVPVHDPRVFGPGAA